MRVGIDARDAADPKAGGWGRYARCLIEALRDVPGIELVLYDESPRVPEMVFEQAVLPRRLARDEVDLVHAPNCFLPLSRPCPGVVSVHDLAFETHPRDFAPATSWKYRHFTPRAVGSAECVIVPSEATRDALIEHYRADHRKIHITPYASALKPASRERSAGVMRAGSGDASTRVSGPYVLVVGDIRGKKNIERLVEAYTLARAAGLPQRLVLAGKGRLKARDGVQVLGWVDEDRLDALYRSADFLVYPSLCEGFGFVTLEAMERGCPVALSRTTSLPEVGGDAAEYFDPESVSEMTEVLLRLGLDPDLRSRLTEAGLRRAAEFSWARTAELTADVYREALEGSA